MPSPGAFLAATSAATDVSAVMAAAADTLRAWVGLGPAFIATADPVTGSFSGTFTFDIPDAAASAFYDNELSGADVVTFASLARAAVPVDSLFAATGRNPQGSARWRDVMSPLGWGDELRAAIRSEGKVWGYLCLHREANDRPFNQTDVARLNNVIPVLSGALRRMQLAAAGAGKNQPRLDTGVILFDEQGRMTGAAHGAAAWLDELSPAGTQDLPLLITGLARHVLITGHSSTSTITTRTGRCGVVEAALLAGPGKPQVVVVLSAASPTQRLDQLAATVGLSPREGEVLGLVVAGLSTKAIAEQLAISVNTVQAHVTAISAKTGHRSRRELISHLGS